MDKDQWQRVEKVFYAAMEMPSDERQEFLRQACKGDNDLLEEVQTLLSANRRTETFLKPPAATPQTPQGASSMRMKHCPKCGKIYPTLARLCQDDRELLSLKDPYHLLGSTLAEKYKILALIGVGGMGAVYCAQHVGIDRRVALKILQPNLAIGNEYVVGLFEREAKLAGRLTHEHIVDVKDAGHTPDGIAYIAMEWLEGRTLDEDLARGPFEFPRAIGIIRQIAEALSVAHTERIIHRDLKPANIMLVDMPDGHDQVKVLDFGIGKILKETTANSPVSALVGTPQYASPEQLTVGGHVDGRSDIYSLGVIFYRLLAGELPFQCASINELLQMQLTATPPSLRTIRPETPIQIEQLIDRMLAKDPGQRPQSAGELIAVLDAMLKDLSSGQMGRETAEWPAKAANRQPDPANAQEEVMQISSAKPASLGSRFSGLAVVVTLVIAAAGYGLYSRRVQTINTGEKTPPGVATPVALPSASAAIPESTATPGAEPTSESGLTPSATINRAQLLGNQQRAAERLQRAQALYKQNDYQNALRECNEALKLNPRSVEARQLQQKITEVLKILNNR